MLIANRSGLHACSDGWIRTLKRGHHQFGKVGQIGATEQREITVDLLLQPCGPILSSRTPELRPARRQKMFRSNHERAGGCRTSSWNRLAALGADRGFGSDDNTWEEAAKAKWVIQHLAGRLFSLVVNSDAREFVKRLSSIG
jgi:hypothetical protein